MPSIDSLPNETLAIIFQHCFSPPKLSPDWSTLHSAIRVCKRWHPIALPVLYSYISLVSTNEAILFVEAVLQHNPSYAAYVKKLNLTRPVLVPVLEKRLAQCAFANLEELQLRPNLCLYMHHSTMPSENRLKRLCFMGKPCQEMMDRHSKSLEALELLFNVRASVKHCGIIPSRPLSLLRHLDLTHQRGSLEVMSKFADLLPGLTDLDLQIEPKDLAPGDSPAFRAALEVFLRKLGKQLLSIKITLYSSQSRHSRVLDGFQLSCCANLQSFCFYGQMLPKWGSSGLRDLPRSLKRVQIDCSVLGPGEAIYVMDMFQSLDQFPELAAMPCIEFEETTPMPVDRQELRSKAATALSAFEARGLPWGERANISSNSIWDLVLLGDGGGEEAESEEDEDDDDSGSEIVAVAGAADPHEEEDPTDGAAEPDSEVIA